MFAADIADFTRQDRDEETQSHLRHALYGAIREALTGSGIAWEECVQRDRGDGALVILPPGMSPHLIIAPFPERLRYLIGRYNRFATPPARLQVRAALNIGPVYRDENGYSGEDINLVCQMLDIQPLRRLLRNTDTDLALTISARVHDTIVLRHPRLADPASFRRVRTRVKRTRIDAWIHEPGSPPLAFPARSANSQHSAFTSRIVNLTSRLQGR